MDSFTFFTTAAISRPISACPAADPTTNNNGISDYSAISLQITSCSGAEGGTSATGIPAGTTIYYQGDGGEQFTLDTSVAAAAGEQTTYNLDASLNAGPKAIQFSFGEDWQAPPTLCISAITVLTKGEEGEYGGEYEEGEYEEAMEDVDMCGGGIWFSAQCAPTCRGGGGVPMDPCATSLGPDDNPVGFGPTTRPCVSEFNYDTEAQTIDACPVRVSPTAGDDPTFVGSDGLAYHVLGEPWKYFNVVSSPTISLNAQFLPVKPGFAHGKITDTVLGTLHLAVCDAATGRTLGVLFDVFSGEHHCT